MALHLDWLTEFCHENTASRATGLLIADNAPCPVHPGARHTWGECQENAHNCANNNNNRSNAQGAGGRQRHGRQQPQQRGEAQGHFVETIDSTMEQEDVSELPGGPTEVSDPAPMVLNEEEQLIVDEPAPRAATAESFPAFSFTASPVWLTLQVDLLQCIAPGPHNGVLHSCHWHKQHSCRSTPSGDTTSHRVNRRCHARNLLSRLWHQ